MILSNPVAVGLVAAIGLATAAFFAHRNEVERLNTVLDKLKAKYNNSKEALETAGTAQELSHQTKLLTESINALSKLAG